MPRRYLLARVPCQGVYAQHGTIVRVAYLAVAMLWWLGATVVRHLLGRCRGTIVLCYHGVSDRQRSGFAWQMNRLADRAIDAADVEAAPQTGARSPRVLVTFDDAFANLLRNALPIMQQLEVPATIFAVPGNLADTPRWPVPPGDPDSPERHERTMSVDDIRSVRSMLCRFGSHTLSHPDLTTLTPALLREQLVQSRIQMQQILQQNVEDIALPFGSYSRAVLAAAREAGYKRVFTLDPCLRPIAPRHHRPFSHDTGRVASGVSVDLRRRVRLAAAVAEVAAAVAQGAAGGPQEGARIRVNTHLEYPDRAEWRKAAAAFGDYSYRQVWDFGIACADRLGACSEHVAIREGTDLLGLADVRIKRLPVVGSGIAYINGAPLVRRNGTSEPQRLGSCLKALLREYVEQRGLVLRVLPALGGPVWNAEQEQVFAGLGFERADAPPYRTLLVAIDPPMEQIRKAFDQKWRNGLNRAERNGLTVRSGDAHLLFEEFCALYRQLLDRKGFDVDLHADFYAAVQRNLANGERFLVSLVDVAGKPAAGHVASALGDTCVYLLGASNDEGMQNKASYLLQWHTIQMARKRDCVFYDLGGIDPDGNPGVYHFKQGLKGMDVTAPGPYEMQPVGLRRHIVRGCERMYRSVRTLWSGVSPKPQRANPRQGAST